MDSVDLTVQQQQTVGLGCAFCSGCPGLCVADMICSFFFQMEGAERISQAAVHLQPRGFV